MFKWLCDFSDWGPLKISQIAANFGSFRHCGSGDKTVLICFVISRDYVFRWLRDFMRGSPLETTWTRDLVTIEGSSKLLIVCKHPAKFGCHNLCGSWDITYLICHVTLQQLVIKGSFNFMGGNSSLYATILSGLVALGIVAAEIFF